VSRYNMSRQNSRLASTTLEVRRSPSALQDSSAPYRKGSSMATTLDMKELMEQDPLLARTLEMREMRNKRKGAKVSISSVVTEITDFSEETCEFHPCGRQALRRSGSRPSTATLPDMSLLGLQVETVEEEELEE